MMRMCANASAVHNAHTLVVSTRRVPNLFVILMPVLHTMPTVLLKSVCLGYNAVSSGACVLLGHALLMYGGNTVCYATSQDDCMYSFVCVSDEDTFTLLLCKPFRSIRLVRVDVFIPKRGSKHVS